jgi:hypothetical protein
LAVNNFRDAFLVNLKPIKYLQMLLIASFKGDPPDPGSLSDPDAAHGHHRQRLPESGSGC